MDEKGISMIDEKISSWLRNLNIDIQVVQEYKDDLEEELDKEERGYIEDRINDYSEEAAWDRIMILELLDIRNTLSGNGRFLQLLEHKGKWFVG